MIYKCVKTEQEKCTHLIDQITEYTKQLLSINSRINEHEHDKKNAAEEFFYISNLSNILNNIPDFDPETERVYLSS